MMALNLSTTVNYFSYVLKHFVPAPSLYGFWRYSLIFICMLVTVHLQTLKTMSSALRNNEILISRQKIKWLKEAVVYPRSGFQDIDIYSSNLSILSHANHTWRALSNCLPSVEKCTDWNYWFLLLSDHRSENGSPFLICSLLFFWQHYTKIKDPLLSCKH